MNYLDIVNDVLIRLRESEVTAVTDNSYSKLIGKYVNDTKRQVEDSFDWPSLYTTYTITTVAGTNQYTITGIGTRFKLINAVNNTKYNTLDFVRTSTLNEWNNINTAVTGPTSHFNFNQADSNGDLKVTVYPTPDAAYTLKLYVYKPQAALSAATDTPLVPEEPIILGAYARALVERGEDGGLNSSEAYQLFKSSLADYIAIQSAYNPADTIWEAQ